MPQNSKSNYLDILQIYRGIAALMVVVHHTVGSLRYYHHVNIHSLNYLGNLGKYGVDFFFILSGFIISYSASFRYENPGAFKEYITNRILRVYIPYLPIGIAMVFLYTLFPDFSNVDRQISVFTSVTLIPFGKPALSVAWTLLFEVMFYFIFGITFFSKKVWHYFITGWAVVLLVVNYTALKPILHDSHPFLRVFMSLYNLEFIAGYLLAVLYLGRARMKTEYVFYISAVALMIFLANFKLKFITTRFVPNMVFTVFIFSMLYISVTKLKFKIDRKNLFMIIGNATFSIYLLHNPLQMMIIRLFPTVSIGNSLIFALLLVFIVSCTAGYIYSQIFEQKVMNTVKKWIEDKRKNDKSWT
ncbi:acyltransferase [Flavobacterium sp.]|uniref:acyltransferase family protein n=1 Tax=Flavobacterium sp. TaxID=239 RepID=UPI0028BE9E3F|nr:acyltransferase [Flavobacterium sp.]